MNTKKIIVDIEVVNYQLRVSKPNDQSSLMPNTKRGIFTFYEVMDPSRFDNSVPGSLKGRAYNKARKIVDRYVSSSTHRFCGSIEISEKDFVPLEKEKN
jgi:hypothetical protein